LRTVCLRAMGRPAWAVTGIVRAEIVRSGRYGVIGSGDETLVLFVSSSSTACPSASATAMTRYVAGTDVLPGSVSVVIVVLLTPAARAGEAPRAQEHIARVEGVVGGEEEADRGGSGRCGPAVAHCVLDGERPACAVVGSTRSVTVRSGR
jgi:hypothetical protein